MYSLKKITLLSSQYAIYISFRFANSQVFCRLRENTGKKNVLVGPLREREKYKMYRTVNVSSLSGSTTKEADYFVVFPSLHP